MAKALRATRCPPLSALARAVLLWAVLCAAAAAESDFGTSSWEVSVGGQVGFPEGEVRVGENQYKGTPLQLRDDLGVDLSGAIELRTAYHLTAKDRLRLSLQTYALNGTTTLPHDVFFNGALFAGGTRLETDTSFSNFFQGSLDYERDLLPLGHQGTIAGTVGLTYVFLNFVLHGTLAPNTPGRETTEDFETQELPLPLLGLRARYPLNQGLDLCGWVQGGYLPWVNSLRSEGGEVRLTQGYVTTALTLRYALPHSFSVEGGFRYTYFVQHEESHEDDNYFRLSNPAITIDLAYRF